MKFGTDINDAQRKKPNDFGNPLTLNAPPVGQGFHFNIYKMDCQKQSYTDIHDSQMTFMIL